GGKRILQPTNEGLMLRVSIDIYGASLICSDNREPTRAEDLPLQGQGQRSCDIVGLEICIHGVMRSTFKSPLQTGGLGFSRDNIDDTPKGIITVQGRAAASHNLNALTALQWHLTPL